MQVKDTSEENNAAMTMSLNYTTRRGNVDKPRRKNVIFFTTWLRRIHVQPIFFWNVFFQNHI